MGELHNVYSAEVAPGGEHLFFVTLDLGFDMAHAAYGFTTLHYGDDGGPIWQCCPDDDVILSWCFGGATCSGNAL